MFMVGKATSNKGWVSFRARVITLFSISQEDEPQESSYGDSLIVICFYVMKAKIGDGYRS